MTPATRFFSYGFRSFFFLAALSALGFMSLWLVALSGTIDYGPDWHGHEMVFRFAGAAVAGFLLTAVPNWTGRDNKQLGRIVALVVLWIMGGVAQALGEMLWLSCLFFFALAFFTGQDIVRAKNKRNAWVPLLVSALGLLSLLYHYGEEAFDLDPQGALYAAIYVLTGLIALIGGRVAPAFTFNALNVPQEQRQRSAFGQVLDKIALPSVCLLVALETVHPASQLTGLAAALLAVILGLRMKGWQSLNLKVWTSPMLAVLHLGYLWTVIGMALKACADLELMGGVISGSQALHALTTGAVGTMVLALGSRASLGHSGRELIAGPATIAAYGLITVAALVRVVGGSDPFTLHFSGGVWFLGWAVFFIGYLKVWIGPSIPGGSHG